MSVRMSRRCGSLMTALFGALLVVASLVLAAPAHAANPTISTGCEAEIGPGAMSYFVQNDFVGDWSLVIEYDNGYTSTREALSSEMNGLVWGPYGSDVASDADSANNAVLKVFDGDVLVGQAVASRAECGERPVVDDDGDSVDNSVDECPDTPSGTDVDATGCSVEVVPDPVFDPQASIIVNDDGSGVATLDNTGSTESVVFEVVVSGKITQVAVSAGETLEHEFSGAECDTVVTVNALDAQLAEVSTVKCPIGPPPTNPTQEPTQTPIDNGGDSCPRTSCPQADTGFEPVSSATQASFAMPLGLAGVGLVFMSLALWPRHHMARHRA